MPTGPGWLQLTSWASPARQYCLGPLGELHDAVTLQSLALVVAVALQVAVIKLGDHELRLPGAERLVPADACHVGSGHGRAPGDDFSAGRQAHGLLAERV